MGALLNAIAAQLQIFVSAIGGAFGILVVSAGLAVALIGVLWFGLAHHYLVKSIVTAVALLSVAALASGLRGG